MGLDKTVADRFMNRIEPEPNSGCWLWLGSRHGKGYGHFRIGPRVEKASRVAWQLFRGVIQPGMLVMHRCDNPPCCNPDHLRLGTNDDNLRDRQSKGRQAAGERSGRALLSEDDVRAIRQLRGIHSATEIGRRFGVAKMTVVSLLAAKSWKTVISAWLVCWIVNGSMVRVVDGDTFIAAADIFPGLTGTLTVRILGVDTPEMQGATLEAAKKARAFTQDWLNKGDVMLSIGCGAPAQDHFGRYLGRVTRDGKSLADELIAGGLGVKR